MDVDGLGRWSAFFNISTAVFGLLAAVCGVAALYFGTKYGDAKDAESGKAIAQAQKDSAEATALAKGYEAQIAASNATAAEAGKDAAMANELARGYEAQIESSKAQAAEALKVAEQERTARLRIEQRLAPRLLEPFQREVLMTRLTRLKGQRFHLVTFPDDQEADTFANVLGQALVNCGWRHVPKSGFLGLQLVLGVHVFTYSDSTPSSLAAADELEKALAAAGIESKRTEWPRQAETGENDIISVRVGKKPST